MTNLSMVGRISSMCAALGIWASVGRAAYHPWTYSTLTMLYSFLFLQNLTSYSLPRWVLEKQVISRACHCPIFALCESHQGTGMSSPFQMTQWTVHLSGVCWRYWQRVQHLCQQFLLVFSCIPAWYCRQHVVASECPLLHACKGTARIITNTTGKVSVVTSSLRRLNCSALFRFLAETGASFQAVSFFLLL